MRRTRPLAQRFWEKVDKNGPTPEHAPQLGPCWLWLGFIQSNGYGKLTVGGNKCWLAHRLAWFLSHGKLPDSGLDHLCWNKACVNPGHLEPTAHGENIRRSYDDPRRKRRSQNATHCKHGHEYSPENVYRWREKRYCLTCRNLYSATRYKRSAISD